jgi:hypothetical protein
MNDSIDEAIFTAAYHFIEQSVDKRVAGSTVWEKARMLIPDLAPVTVPARLRRLVSNGLLEKDKGRSGAHTKVYAPTELGFKKWAELK